MDLKKFNQLVAIKLSAFPQIKHLIIEESENCKSRIAKGFSEFDETWNSIDRINSIIQDYRVQIGIE